MAIPWLALMSCAGCAWGSFSCQMIVALFNTFSSSDLARLSLLVIIQRTLGLRLSCHGRAAKDTHRDRVRHLCESVLERGPQSLVPGLLIQLLEDSLTLPCPVLQGWHQPEVHSSTAGLRVPWREKDQGPSLLCPREKVVGEGNKSLLMPKTQRKAAWIKHLYFQQQWLEIKFENEGITL